jgi:hypothetical protein
MQAPLLDSDHAAWSAVWADARASETLAALCWIWQLNRQATPPMIKLFIIRATASAASFDEICVFMSVSCQSVVKMSFPLMAEQLPCQILMFVKSLFLKTIFS